MSETTDRVDAHDARIENAEARVLVLEQQIERILAHLDPCGTSQTLFPAQQSSWVRYETEAAREAFRRKS